MSYRNLKVNSVGLDSDNDISINSANLIETGRAGINCVLRKTATGWGTPSCLKSYSGHLNFQVDSHGGNTAYRYDPGDNYQSRNLSGEYDLSDQITFVGSSGSYVTIGNSGWPMAYTFDGTFFNGKKVLLKALIGPSRVFANSYYSIQWRLGSPFNALSSTTPLGAISYSTDQYGSIVYGLYEGTGTTETLSMRFIDVYGCAITTGTPANIQSITAKIIE